MSQSTPRALLDGARGAGLSSGLYVCSQREAGGSAMTFLDYYLIVLGVALVALLVYKFKH